VNDCERAVIEIVSPEPSQVMSSKVDQTGDFSGKFLRDIDFLGKRDRKNRIPRFLGCSLGALRKKSSEARNKEARDARKVTPVAAPKVQHLRVERRFAQRITLLGA